VTFVLKNKSSRSLCVSVCSVWALRRFECARRLILILSRLSIAHQFVVCFECHYVTVSLIRNLLVALFYVWCLSAGSFDFFLAPSPRHCRALPNPPSVCFVLSAGSECVCSVPDIGAYFFLRRCIIGRGPALSSPTLCVLLFVSLSFESHLFELFTPYYVTPPVSPSLHSSCPMMSDASLKAKKLIIRK